MSKDTSKDLQLFLDQQKHDFETFNSANNNALNFKQECLFARQQILKNDFSLKISRANPLSLRDSISNVAAIGISLNPALRHAYLVPMDGKINLSVSYIGFIKLATDTGVIKWAKAELVYANDTFEYKGMNEMPTFVADIFGDRGELVGGFCVAKTNEGDCLIDTMSLEELNKTRDTSKAYQSAENNKKQNSVWHIWAEEMYKKTIIKRAAKTWPQSDGRQRLDKAVEVVNQSEGLTFEPYTLEEKEMIDNFIELGDADPEKNDEFRSIDFVVYLDSLGDESKINLFNSFPKGEKTALKKIWSAMEQRGYSVLNHIAAVIQDAYDETKDEDAIEVLYGLSDHAKSKALSLCSSAAAEWASTLETQ